MDKRKAFCLDNKVIEQKSQVGFTPPVYQAKQRWARLIHELVAPLTGGTLDQPDKLDQGLRLDLTNA
jgi:hypothetical protein